MENIMEQAVIKGIGFNHLDEGMGYITKWTPTIISAGGCGIFALLLYDHLGALGIDRVIKAIVRKEPWRMDVEDNLIGYVNGKNGVEEVGVMHVCVYASIEGHWVYIDNHGINDHWLMGTLRRADLVDLTREQLNDIHENSKSWNPIFDRSTVPVIMDRMRDVFSGVTLHYPDIPVLYTEHTTRVQRQITEMSHW